MANEINNLQTIRVAVASIAVSVEKLGTDLHKTQVQMTALKAVVATILVQTLRLSPEQASQLLRHAEEVHQSGASTDPDLSAIQSILKNLQSGNLGKA